MKRILAGLLVFSLAFSVMCVSMEAEAKENVVIMIDPGHGGSNLGATPETGYVEKNMTLVTALAMKNELEKYQGVTVYLTRNTDAELSLEQRAQLAKSVNADFLYSLHYNMSANHFFYGSEVWTEGTGDNYVKGYSQGQLFLEEFVKKGLFSRGVKVKRGKSGDEYYGILRHSNNMGIPAVIVEHCHLDHVNDFGFYDSVEKMQEFGKADAAAVAKYFGLSSKELKVNFTGYPKASFAPSYTPKVQDLTPPEISLLSVLSKDEAGKKLKVQIQASDSDTGIMYYAYSTNGGASWSALQIWPSAAEQTTLEIPASFNGNRNVIFAVFNSYDGMTLSNAVTY